MSELLTNKFIRFSRPGHFYSPIPDSDEVNRTYDAVFNHYMRCCHPDVLGRFLPVCDKNMGSSIYLIKV